VLREALRADIQQLAPPARLLLQTHEKHVRQVLRHCALTEQGASFIEGVSCSTACEGVWPLPVVWWAAAAVAQRERPPRSADAPLHNSAAQLAGSTTITWLRGAHLTLLLDCRAHLACLASRLSPADLRLQGWRGAGTRRGAAAEQEIWQSSRAAPTSAPRNLPVAVNYPCRSGNCILSIVLPKFPTPAFGSVCLQTVSNSDGDSSSFLPASDTGRSSAGRRVRQHNLDPALIAATWNPNQDVTC